MDKAKISYAGVGASVAGVIGILGIYSGLVGDRQRHPTTAPTTSRGSSRWRWPIGLFAFGGAYVS